MSHKSSLFAVIILIVMLVTTGGSAQAPDISNPNELDVLLGTAITYQGKLSDGGASPTGSYDFQFILYNAAAGGAQVGSIVLKDDVPVSGGLFTVQLDFGAGIFGADSRWLEVGVRPGASTGSYTILSPRQPISPAPAALYSPAAGSVPWSGVTGVPSLQTRVSGTCAANNSIRVINPDGSVICELDDNTTYTAGTGLKLIGTQINLVATYTLPQSCSNGQAPQWTGSAWDCGSFWGLTGNSGTSPATNYLGTSDNQPLELRVNGQRALRLEPITTATHGFTTNLLGGYNGNTITAGASGVTIAGGGKSGWLNWVTDDFGTIGGGLNNQVGDNSGDFLSAPAATVGGGSGNKATGDAATGSGGWGNSASNMQATVSGGEGNTASGNYAYVGGGSNNAASGNNSTVPGGSTNTAAGNYSFAAGYNAQTAGTAVGSFVWADATGSSYVSNSPNEFRVRATGGVRFLTNNVDGLIVDNSGLTTNGDGIHVDANVSLGSNYGAVYARNTGTSPGIVASTGSGGTYAGVFTKMISVSGGCVGCTLVYLAQNNGSEPLEMGDVTAAAGVGDHLNGTQVPLILVRRAGGTDAAGVVGVVLGKAVLNEGSQDGLTLIGAEAAAGPAAPGEYVFIVVQGVAYVKADASNGAIVTGQRLTASSEAGLARALQTRTLEGMIVTEAAPIIGITLAPLEKGQGLILVMVTLH